MNKDITARSANSSHLTAEQKTANELRSNALAFASIDQIQSMSQGDLISVMSILGHGSVMGFWTTPQSWFPLGRNAELRVDLNKRIYDALSESDQLAITNAEKWRRGDLLMVSEIGPTIPDQIHLNTLRVMPIVLMAMTRYLVLLRTSTIGLGMRAKAVALDPSNIARMAYKALPKLFALGASHLLNEQTTASHLNTTVNTKFLEKIDLDLLATLPKYLRDEIRIETNRMNVFAANGIWNDVPPEINTRFDTKSEPIKNEAQKKTDKHLPFPDEFISEMGSSSLWIIESLGPNIIKIIADIQSIWDREDLRLPNSKNIGLARARAVKKYLASYEWQNESGNIFSDLPIKLYMSKNEALKAEDDFDLGDKDEFDDSSEESIPRTRLIWPPKNFATVLSLAKTLQMAHMFVVAMGMASRKSEILTLERDCIRYTSNGIAHVTGRTYKLVESYDGELRDWVIPELAIVAIEQQIQLVKLIETLGPARMKVKRYHDIWAKPPKNLWITFGGFSNTHREAPNDVQKSLHRYALCLGMDTMPGGQSIRLHRFRKTIARLVALAITQAPKVLMDVFGHKSIEMTLYYILTDKDLRAEIEIVSRELRVMRAKEVIEKIVEAENDAGSNVSTTNGYGGPAALVIKNSIAVHKSRLHRHGDEWGANSAIELAELLTLQGKAWQIVRPGVICTKFPGTESGPCNQSKGHPEPSRCRTSCQHRLEEAYLREDVDNSIGVALAAYHQSEKDDDILGKAMWAGQIRVHIGRFEDLREKWSSDPNVQKLLVEQSEEGVIV